MSDVVDDARDFLAEAVRASGLAPYALAKKAQVSPTTITRPLNDPTFKFTPKPATLLKIAKAAGLDLPATLASLPRALPSAAVDLPLLGPIQAGAFLQMDDTDQDEPPRLRAALDPRYPPEAQWLREVQGESMNARFVFPGDLAHVVDFAVTGLPLTTGQIVEVHRLRDGGMLREITLKEVEVTAAGVLLWPRSTNPRWRDAVQLASDDGTDVEVRVTGLLVTTIRRF